MLVGRLAALAYDSGLGFILTVAGVCVGGILIGLLIVWLLIRFWCADDGR